MAKYIYRVTGSTAGELHYSSVRKATAAFLLHFRQAPPVLGGVNVVLRGNKIINRYTREHVNRWLLESNVKDGLSFESENYLRLDRVQVL